MKNFCLSSSCSPSAAALWYFNRPVTELQLTGIVTTNDVVVGPQIGGRIDKLLVNEATRSSRDSWSRDRAGRTARGERVRVAKRRGNQLAD
jgi:hypothetical protein